MNDNIIKWIKAEVSEFTDAQYIAEVMSSPTEKYRHMEANLASSLLHAMSFMSEEITGEPLSIDDLSPEIASGLLFRNGSYESIEFIRALMDNYEQELEKYKTIRTGEITREMKLSAEIDAMDKDELVFAIAKAHGISIYNKAWPCYYYEKELYAMEAKYIEELTEEEIKDEKDIDWPVTRIGGSEEHPVLEPLMDYPGLTIYALQLVSDLKSHGFRLSTSESIAKGTYTCSFLKETPYNVCFPGSSLSLAVAISKAYLKVLLFDLNPDAIRRVFDEKSADDTNNVEAIQTS